MDLNLLLLLFSLIFKVVSRLLLYCTIDKKSRLKVRSFSTVRDTQRGSQSYKEKRRGRRETDMTRSRRGRLKRGEERRGKDGRGIAGGDNILPDKFIKRTFKC